MRILAIETSCDETAVALLEIVGPPESPEIKILGNSLFSQAHLHAEYGGVYPNLAKREHQKNLQPLLERTLKVAGEDADSPNIDYICVTQGPGLEPALWVGITFAKELGQKWSAGRQKVPVIPVDHMEGHIWSTLYQAKQPLELPALALLVSGGHTELVRVKDFGQYEILGKTRDDAVGEAFDKVARMLGLGYPGGPKISKLAEVSRKQSGTDRDFPSVAESRQPQTNSEIVFPRPMINSGDLDFSYSGLKTAVLYYVKNNPPQTEGERGEVARAFEDSAIDVLISKTRQALDAHHDTRTLIVGGGVAANQYLQKRLHELVESYPQVTLRMPEASLSTDNAIMIGIAGFVRISIGQQTKGGNIIARGNLSLGSSTL